MSVSLSAKQVVKRYGGVVALADGNLDVKAGEVLALLGANGSGKSTLSKIITGVVAPNEGQLHLDGKQIAFNSPSDARKVGIAAVYQELSLIPDMTVMENIWLTHEPRTLWWVDKAAMRRNTRDLLALFDGTNSAGLIPDALVKDLPPDERQIVEICKALSHEPRLIILDEATASLDSQQVQRLHELVQGWKARGMAIVFVSHRMEEIRLFADRATVLRNGRSVGTRDLADTTDQELVELMIEGAVQLGERAHAPLPNDAPVRLKVSGLRAGRLRDISFEVRDGELLGIGGLHGQGQSELLLALFGAMPFNGSVVLSGETVHFRHPRQAMARDVAFVPGDRATEGLLLSRSILENLHLPSWTKFGTPLKMDRARAEARSSAEEMQLIAESLDAPASSLSGGNAQKVVIGKWLLRSPKLLLLNDPTKGVDVGAKGEFYHLLDRLRQSGTAIIFYSSDDDELLGLCDRVLVFHDGRLTAELAGDQVTRANLITASMGGRPAVQPQQ
ncbi:MAG: sugar ABC transporter ATP-binding protein [Chloroflexi bacterium]|nr:sugar ABC transporter ATP-binding protein [Chloroflexota bacterium]